MHIKKLEDAVAEKLGVKCSYLFIGQSTNQEGRVEICFGTDEDDTYSAADDVKKKHVLWMLETWMTNDRVSWSKKGDWI